MAVAALASDSLLMFIVFLVASVTVSRCFVGVQPALVTAFAPQSDMLSSKRICRMTVMIECNGLPMTLDVTISA